MKKGWQPPAGPVNSHNTVGIIKAELRPRYGTRRADWQPSTTPNSVQTAVTAEPRVQVASNRHAYRDILP